MGKSETMVPGGTGQRVANIGIFQFLGAPAPSTDEELHGMDAQIVALTGVDAAYERGQTFDFVDQPVFQQEVESAVHGRRGGPLVPAPQMLEQVIGAGRLGAVQDETEDLASQARQLNAALPAQQFGPIKARIRLGRARSPSHAVLRRLMQ
jgi:hypothetical protein